MRVEAGRLEILRELVDIQDELCRAAGLVNGLRVAVAETIQGEQDERSDSETVFSVKLNIE